MTVLIISSLGASKNYPNQDMLRKTLNGFLNSLANQTDQDFRLFISYSDKPVGVDCEHSFVHWLCMAPTPGDTDHMITPWPIIDDNPLTYEVGYITMPFARGGDRVSKIYNSAIEAVRWAKSQGLDEFWMQRLDSDDLLAMNTVETIHKLGEKGVEAVYNKICHMYDPNSGEIAVHRYPYSTACNVIRLKLKGNEIEPKWDFILTDHTRFEIDVRSYKIPFKEIDYAFCICTNTGNSLSGRGRIDGEKNVEKVPLTRDLIERYGLDSFGEMK